ncbi:threonine aldolase family protein [Tepidibacter mesophilus]|uniref:threonine aldolase family protein n=1 Tax=Tepidibacter mesophilus TaxID=655607 RepID=UPI000C070A69|nr:low specificity L-threonine aldolase [Tepidibacter mesophilus]
MKMFLSDNNSGVHPKIIEAMVKANEEHVFPYGNDVYTKKAELKFKELFGENIDVYFVLNGTAANVIGLSAALRSYESIICTDSAHINGDECGAVEKFTGSKLLQVPNSNGKISIDDIEKMLKLKGNYHRTQPKMISISQCSEFGTVYTVEEIKEISKFAHENDLYLHVDGSRISNAAVSLNTNLKEMITEAGVDILSFGGTKNGLMFGEAILILNPNISEDLKYIRKQGMQLISKMRYISAQFIEYLENDLYYKNAKQANDMASLLENELKNIKQIKITYPVQSNMVFMKIPKDVIKYIENKYEFYTIDENEGLIRIVTSFDTTEKDIENFVNDIKLGLKI